MLTPLPALLAYRTDLERNPARRAVSDCDGAWILIARMIEQFLEVGKEERVVLVQRLSTQLATLAAHPGLDPAHVDTLTSVARSFGDTDDSGLNGSVFDDLVRLAEEMEERGALNLAYGMLGHLRAASPRADSRRLGGALAVQGRIARELGDLDSAADHFRQLLAAARGQRDTVTVSRACHGLGGIALATGNLPEARAQYERALRSARQAADRDLEGRAHRGLLIVAAKESDFDAALRHGWAAYELFPGSRASQAELLGNLAGLCREAGYPAASLAGYSLALLWSDAPRIRFPALGGAAIAAALTGEAAHLETIARRIEQDVRDAPPYEEAQVLLDLAVAMEVALDARALSFAQRAERIADLHRYHEISHYAREMQERLRVFAPQRPRAPLDLSTPGALVVESMTALANRESAFSALAGTTG